MIIAEGIKTLKYLDTDEITEDLTLVQVKTLMADADEIKNVHEDTWSFEQTDATVDSFKNQLTGGTYRQNEILGETSMNFTIGQYEFQTKADLMGGTATANSWKSGGNTGIIHKALFAITNDNVYIVFPKATISARSADTDGAIGLAVVATAMEPDNKEVSAEYWFVED